MLATITGFSIGLFVHVLAVVLAFGPTFGYGIFIGVAEGSAPRSVPAVLRGIQRTDRFLVQPGFQFGEGRLQDISAAGFCLLLNHPLALKTRLVIQLPGRRPGSSLSRTALVVRVKEEKPGSWLLGCQLNSPLSPEELSRLQTAVAGA